MSWLPRKLAPQVRCIFSTVDDSAQHKILTNRETKPMEIFVPPLDKQSRKVMYTVDHTSKSRIAINFDVHLFLFVMLVTNRILDKCNGYCQITNYCHKLILITYKTWKDGWIWHKNIVTMSDVILQVIVANLLEKHDKSLSEDQMNRLLEKDLSANLLWLSVACQELQVLNQREEIDRKIQDMPAGLLKYV